MAARKALAEKHQAAIVGTGGPLGKTTYAANSASADRHAAKVLPIIREVRKAIWLFRRDDLTAAV